MSTWQEAIIQLAAATLMLLAMGLMMRSDTGERHLGLGEASVDWFSGVSDV